MPPRLARAGASAHRSPCSRLACATHDFEPISMTLLGTHGRVLRWWVTPAAKTRERRSHVGPYNRRAGRGGPDGRLRAPRHASSMTTRSTRAASSPSATRGSAQTVDAELEAGLLWPEPLVQLNPSFAPGGTIDDLVADGTLTRDLRAGLPGATRAGRRGCRERQDAAALPAPGGGDPGRARGRELRPDHRAPAPARASPTSSRSSTTSCATGPGKGIKAIVVYPMNALANSQAGELEKFLQLRVPEQRGPRHLRPLHRAGGRRAATGDHRQPAGHPAHELRDARAAPHAAVREGSRRGRQGPALPRPRRAAHVPRPPGRRRRAARAARPRGDAGHRRSRSSGRPRRSPGRARWTNSRPRSPGSPRRCSGRRSSRRTSSARRSSAHAAEPRSDDPDWRVRLTARAADPTAPPPTVRRPSRTTRSRPGSRARSA